MQNQVNPQNIQAQPYVPQQTYPAPSVGAVNIQIFNPVANPAPGFYQPASCGAYPCNYNNMIQTPQIQAPPQNAQQIAPDMNVQNNIAPDNSQMNLNAAANGVAAQGDGSEGKATEKAKENKPKVNLTDDYIKTLENYLNSQDKKIRLMGAKELLDRFKEDETRKEDPALTALLNKTIQDPAETVKFVGLTALDAGYATGNNETAQILTQMQSSTSSYGEDATLASKILLKMSGNQTMQNNAQAPVQQAEAQNLQPLNNNQPNTLNKMPNPNDGVLMTKDAQNMAVANSQVAQNGNIQ